MKARLIYLLLLSSLAYSQTSGDDVKNGDTAISIGSGDTADAGAIRLENGASLGWEASPTGTDVSISVNASEQYVFDGLDCSAGDQYITSDASGVLSCGTDDGGGSVSWSALIDPTAATSFTSGVDAETITFDFQSAFSTDRFIIQQTTGNPTAGDLVSINLNDSDVQGLHITAPGSAAQTLLELENAGPVRFGITNSISSATDDTWLLRMNNVGGFVYGNNSMDHLEITEAGDFVMDATDPADAGKLRLANADSVCWEASPAGTDVCMSVNATEQYVLDGIDCSAGDQYLTTDASGILSCGTDNDSGGSSFGTIGAAVADSGADTITVTDSSTIDFTTTDNPEDLTAIVISGSIGSLQIQNDSIDYDDFDFSSTLASDKLMLAGELLFSSENNGGCLLAEGSTGDVNEQLHCFVSQNGADTTDFFVMSAETDGLVTDTIMDNEDFGDFTCTSAEDGCTVDANAVTRDKVEAELRTEQFCFVHANPDTDLAATEDFNSIYMNITQPITITQVTCESDDGTGSPTINFQRDDGTPADILSSDLTCGTTPTNGTIAAAEDNIAVDEEIDYLLETVSAGLRRISVCIEYTID